MPFPCETHITQTVGVFCVDLGFSRIQCSSIIMWPLSVSDYGSKLWPESKNGCQKESVGLPQAAPRMRAKSLQSCLTLYSPMDCSPLGSSVLGILQTGDLKWVAMSFSRGSSPHGIESTSFTSPALAGMFFTTSTTWEAPND